MNAPPSTSGALAGSSLGTLRSHYKDRRNLRWRRCCKALSFIGLLGLSASLSAAPIATERSAVHSSFADLPLTFEVNQGQTDRQVDFLARGQGYTLFLTPTEAVFALLRSDGAPTRARSAVRMRLVGSAPDSRVQGLEELPGKVNYFRGNDSSKWGRDVRTFRKVRYSAVYPGVDLIYYGQPQQLEYDFIVAPGADPSAIQLYSTYLGGHSHDGSAAIAVDLAGAAYISGSTFSTDFPTTDAFQPVCTGLDLENAFVAKLTPDGSALAYSTFLAGNSRDGGSDIAVDSLGTAYVTGVTESADFPTVKPVQPYMAGEGDAFVAKLAPDGKSLIYSTHLGGSNTDRGWGIAADTSGAAYVTGLTLSPDFPKVNPLQPVAGRAFVLKLPPEGGTLMYSTPLGGSGFDQGFGISVDTAGAAYVTGETESPDFPTKNPLQAYGGGSDAFVAKLAPNGTALVYSTYLGGGDRDHGAAIAVDLAGAAYITGFTSSPNFPTVQPLQANLAGVLARSDAFIAKITEDCLAAAPVNDSGSEDQSGDGSGGGAIDALLAVLLAQLALAHALRRCSRSCSKAKLAVSVISLPRRRA